MSDKIQIIIEGRNNAKAAFTEVTNGATQMGQAVTRASETAGQASTQMGEQLEQSAARSSASYEKIGRAIGQAGLAFGAFTLITGKIAGDAEASTARLETAFTNAGKSVDDFQSQINDLNSTGLKLAFDDEDVQDALSRLVTATGDVEKSFQQVGIAEDLARAQGISLAAATNVIVQADAGRYRGLAQLGIAIDANATKEEALAAIQDKVAGSAAAYATTGAANFDRWKNSAENALESVGGKLEGLQVPILALSTAATALGPLVTTLKDVATAEKAAAIAGAASDLALGPVGLAAAALAAGAGIYYLITQTDDYTSSADIASGATQDLNNYFTQLASTLDPVHAAQIKNFGDAFVSFVDAAASRSDDLAAIAKTQAELSANAKIGAPDSITISNFKDGYNGLTQAQLAYIDMRYAATQADHDGKVSLEEITAALADYQANLAQLNPDQTTAVLSDVTKIFSQSTVDIDKARQGINLWEDQLASGSITAEQFTANMDNAAADFRVFARDTSSGTTAVEKHTTATNANANAVAAQMAVYDAQNQSLNQAIEFNIANTAAIDDDTAARKANASAIESQMAAYSGQNASLGESPYQSNRSDAIGQIDESGNARSALANLLDLFNEMNPAVDETSHATAGLAGGMDDLAQRSQAADQALRDQLGGYYDLASGIYTADSAQAAFKATQDGLIGSENVYNQQLSEYSGQLNSLTGAYDIIQEKQANGVQLTQQELDFLDKYPDAYARLTGGQDDAIESAGMLALQYAENMKQGDELNKSMKDQTKSTTDLVDEIKELIDTLLGVPPDVKSNVHVDGVDAASQQLDFMKRQLDALDGRVVTSYAQVRSSGSIFFPGTSAQETTGRLGGVMGYAGGGVVARMAEAGPELLHFSNGGSALALTDGLYNVPRGTFVDTAPATKAKLGGMGGETIVIQNMTVIANDPEQFSRQLRSHAVTGSRR
jgi:hypothetical protein